MNASPHEGHRERLRTRYQSEGADGFADHELLELLLTYALPRRDTNALAHALLTRFGSLAAVLEAEIPQLMLVDGVGAQAATLLKLVRDTARRLQLRELSGRGARPRLNTPCAAAQYALHALADSAYETVLAVFLSARREVIGSETIQLGSLTEAQVYPRRVAEAALLGHAHSVILLHNHPTGDPAPSESDAAVTRAVEAALAALDIRLSDHLVVGDACVYSFAADRIIDLSAGAPASLTVDEWAEARSARRPAMLRVMEDYPG